MKINDKVRSSKSLWGGDIGIISGFTPIYALNKANVKIGEIAHVIFPENDKHYGYQQSIDVKDLILV